MGATPYAPCNDRLMDRSCVINDVTTEFVDMADQGPVVAVTDQKRAHGDVRVKRT